MFSFVSVAVCFLLSLLLCVFFCLCCCVFSFVSVAVCFLLSLLLCVFFCLCCCGFCMVSVAVCFVWSVLLCVLYGLCCCVFFWSLLLFVLFGLCCHVFCMVSLLLTCCVFCMVSVAVYFVWSPVILFGQIYLLLQEAFPIQKWPYFSQFCVFFPKYNEKSLHFFPKCNGTGSFPRTEVKTLVSVAVYFVWSLLPCILFGLCCCVFCLVSVAVCFVWSLLLCVLFGRC